jgi:DNA-binding response OmpR family regulator
MPMIVVTARQDIVEAAIKEGANEYVTKPFDPDQLVEKVSSILRSTA